MNNRNLGLYGTQQSTWRMAAASEIGGILAIGFPLAVLQGAGAASFEQSQQRVNAGRFDLTVREDFFSGFAGDSEALARGMKKCEEVRAKYPTNAEALVWHGSGLSYSAKREFMASKLEKGGQIQAQGLGEMNGAVAMRPDDAAVLIPRAAVFLSAAVHVPSPEIAK